MWQKQTRESSSVRESIKTLEADIQHANSLAASLPRDLGGNFVQMKLGYSPLAPFLIFLIEWMDYNCLDALPRHLGLLHILVYRVYLDGMPMISSQERKATVGEFYAVMYPSLKLLEGHMMELMEENQNAHRSDSLGRKAIEEKIKLCKDLDREDECGICMETDSKAVLPNCGHSMCISCFHDWYARSQSCPFCRGSLKRVSSGDLWILTSNYDVVDTICLAKENLTRFYLYIEKLPLVGQEKNLVLEEYLSWLVE